MRRRVRSGGGRPKKLATAYLFARTGGWKKAEFQCGTCRQKRLYRSRNCKKYFPELVQIDRKPCWIPRATAGKTAQVALKGYEINECPVSFITGKSQWMLDLIQENGVANEMGATLYGTDSRKHPAWWIDAIAVVGGARAEFERAEIEAMKLDAGNR